MVATKDLIAVSNGSAYRSSSYAPSHVLTGKGMGADGASGCGRLSWCHPTLDLDRGTVAERIRGLR